MKTFSAFYMYLGTMALLAWGVVYFSGVPAYEIAHFKSAPIALARKGVTLEAQDIERLDRRDALSVLGELSARTAREMGLCVLRGDKTYLVELSEGVFEEMPGAAAVEVQPGCFLTSEFRYQ